MHKLLFLENNEAYRDRAMKLRNQGITVNPHKSWDDTAKAKRQARYRDADKGSWRRLFIVAREAWRGAKADAIADYQRAVFPERFEAIDPVWSAPAMAEDIPF